MPAGTRRGRIRGGAVNHHADRFLGALLAELDGFDSRSNVAIISASNRKDLIDPALLNEREILVMESLHARKKLTVSELSDLVELRKVIPLVNNLLEKGLIYTEETLEERYKPKLETFVRLAQPYRDDEESLREVYRQIDELERSEIESVRFVDYKELFGLFALAALGLLLAEAALANTVFRRIP